MMPEASPRSLARWGEAVEHADLDAFEAAPLVAGAHSIRCGDARIDLWLRPLPGAPLVVFFYGAMDRAKEVSVPIFRGTQITEGLGASFVSIADPSLALDRELGLGWFAGSAGLALQALLPRVIARLEAALAAPRLVLLGGSGGGFAALFYAVHFPHCLAVVWNPQTDIRRYWKRHVAAYGRAAFGIESWDAFIAAMPDLIQCDLGPWYAARYSGHAVLYLQNLGDAHVARQAAPFFRRRAAVEWTAPQNRAVWAGFWLCLRAWGEGHVMPPRAALRALLAALLAPGAAAGRALVETGAMAAIVEAAFAPPACEGAPP